MSATHQADPLKRARLRWRSRRGLLENDLILSRFLEAHETALNDEEVDALSRLLDLSDNDLMNLLLQNAELKDVNTELDLPHIRKLLARLRNA